MNTADKLRVANEHYDVLLAENIRLKAELAAVREQLAAVPQWTRITDDPATWPQDVPMVDVIWWDGDRPHLTTCAILRHRIQYLPTHGAWMLAKPETANE